MSFEDCERTRLELKAYMFKSIYVWLARTIILVFLNFWTCVLLFRLNWGLSCTLCVLELCPSALESN